MWAPVQSHNQMSRHKEHCLLAMQPAGLVTVCADSDLSGMNKGTKMQDLFDFLLVSHSISSPEKYSLTQQRRTANAGIDRDEPTRQ